VITAEEPGNGPGPPAAAPGERGEPKHAERIVVRDNRRVKTTAAGGEDTPAGGSADRSADEPATPVDAPANVAGADSADPSGPAVAAGGLGAELTALRSELDERTGDLQRVSAEYANYRKRMERQRSLAAEEATSNVFRALLPVFDDLDRAREHEELSEGVTAVVEHLITAAGKFGLMAFGEPGDPFDPTRHEAVAHRTSPDVTGPSCVEVLRRGYLLGDRLLRPAMVAVADPEPEPQPEPEPPSEPEQSPEQSPEQPSGQSAESGPEPEPN
jgi:molecular chaperone GrpE